MSTPFEGGRPLLRGRVLGFPVHLDLSFVVIMAALGYYPGVTLRNMAIWLLITPLAVLVHELGHAVAARANGAHPQIALAGFGGVTSWSVTAPLTRVRSLVISLAGPFVGLAIGVVLLAARIVLDGSLDPSGIPDRALLIGVYTCIGWSLLNLLPVLPLDGGQAMRELLPGDPQVRTRRAAGVSVVVAVAAALAAWFVFDQVFVAVFMVFFALSNVAELRAGAPSRPAPPPTPEQAVVAGLWAGETAQARAELEALPPGTSVDLAVHGAVLALSGDRQQGHALLAQEAQRRPQDANVAALTLLAFTLAHDWDGVVATLQGPIGPHVPPAVVERAVHEARSTGREDVAGRLEQLATPR